VYVSLHDFALLNKFSPQRQLLNPVVAVQLLLTTFRHSPSLSIEKFPSSARRSNHSSSSLVVALVVVIKQNLQKQSDAKNCRFFRIGERRKKAKQQQQHFLKRASHSSNNKLLQVAICSQFITMSMFGRRLSDVMSSIAVATLA